MFVRLGLERDEDAIVEMARLNCALSTPHLEFAEEKVRDAYRDYLATCSTTFFVAERDERSVGFLMAGIYEYRHAYGLFVAQEVIFVRPECRGSRAAALLMKHLVEWAQGLGAKEITGGNDNAFQSDRTAKFLIKFGFEPVGFFMRRKFTNE